MATSTTLLVFFFGPGISLFFQTFMKCLYTPTIGEIVHFDEHIFSNDFVEPPTTLPETNIAPENQK